MFYVDSELDYSSVINSDHRESWGSNQLYPAIVRVHTEMPAQNVPLHWHLGSELVYARHGDVRLFIDGMDVTLRSGQLCLISPKALHSIHPMPHDDSQNVLSISFDGEYLSRMCPELANIRLNQGVVYGVDGIVDGQLLGLCEQIVGCVENDGSALQMLQLNALLYELLYHVCTQCTVMDCYTTDGEAKHISSNASAVLHMLSMLAMLRLSAKARVLACVVSLNIWNGITRRICLSGSSHHSSAIHVSTSLDYSNAAQELRPTDI